VHLVGFSIEKFEKLLGFLLLTHTEDVILRHGLSLLYADVAARLDN
jgi:hypothetical protein